MADGPAAPNPENQQAHFHVEGPIQNLIYGSHIVGDQTAAGSQSVYQKRMAKHGAAYWVLHVIVAVAAAALWEYRYWFLHFLK